MLAIVDGRPETLGLKQIIKHHIDFQYEIATRKYTTLLNKELDNKEIKEGLIKACDIIDLIIEILRGSKNLKMAKDMGYHTFFWSLAYVDWYENKQPTHEEAFKKLLGRIHPGAIVLLHSTSKTNGEILDELLTKWEEMGFRFGSLDELTGNA